MGLDISYYKNLERFDGEDEDYDKLHISEAIIDFSNDFKGGKNKRAEGLSAGIFDAEEEGGFRAGSYGGYNQWRNNLALAAHDVPASLIWNHPENFDEFVELINFADNEGVIGPVVARKLAADFENSRAKVSERMKEVPWFMELYEKWAEAFKAASDNGCVDFH